MKKKQTTPNSSLPTNLILMRHGESVWNKKNIFTGWVDVPLSVKGVEEAIEAGKLIKDIPIDIIFTSTLIRAEMTAMLSMLYHQSGKAPCVMPEGEGELASWEKVYSDKAKHDIIPVIRAWQLNERMYGELQGLNKAETAAEFGADQVKIWRRSFDVAPPQGESLKMTAARTVPYFEEQIVHHLQAGRHVFIAAHGNSLRSIIMYLDRLTPEQVVSLEIPTGVPILYTYTNGAYTKVTT
jgi:2,3-bisphosphoglycerate-dependent phosphoglycerate mutase